jgi:hypothetical protein
MTREKLIYKMQTPTNQEQSGNLAIVIAWLWGIPFFVLATIVAVRGY